MLVSGFNIVHYIIIIIIIVQTFGKRHLEYLQLFEKEMTANYLRRMKEKEKSSLEMTVSRLQKRYCAVLTLSIWTYRLGQTM